MNSSLGVIPLENSFFEVPFAHRGLHDCNESFGAGRPENSFAAFRAAISRGYGIEVDIQLSADGIPIVFHDRCLKRILRINENVNRLTLESLQKLRLTNKEKIPTLDEFLKLVSGKVPILVELKDQFGFLSKTTDGIEDVVAKSLKKYEGPVAVMAFNPHYVKSFGLKLPSVPRGLVTESFKHKDWPELNKKKLISLRNLKGVREIGASFISHKYSDLISDYISSIPPTTKIFSWTIRNQLEMKLALRHCDNVTFEGFLP